MPKIACQGDRDDKGHTITGSLSSGIKVNGKPVAVQGSTMDDGASINGGVVNSIKINGTPVATVGSTTTPHPRNPGRNQRGTIQTGSDGVAGAA